MKDAYWLGVDYGVAQEAERLGVKMQLVEAGGYTELNNQISQIEDCVAAGANAVIIGAISFDGLNNIVKEISGKGIPVIDVINGMSSPDLSAKSLVSFGEMGGKAGAFLAEKHPAKAATRSRLPGSRDRRAPAGSKRAIPDFPVPSKGSAVDLVETKYGDTGKEAQAKLVEDTLEAHPDLNYVVGTAVTAEAAIPILRVARTDRPGQGRVLLLHAGRGPGHPPQADPRGSDGFACDTRSHRGSTRQSGSWKASPTRSMSAQPCVIVTQDNLADFDPSSTLAPNGFKPVFRVD